MTFLERTRGWCGGRLHWGKAKLSELRHRTRLQIIFVLTVLFLVFLLFEFFYRQSRATSHLSAQSELVEIRVTDPETAGVGLQQMRLHTRGATGAPCVTGVLLPWPGTRLRFEKGGFGPVQVELLLPEAPGQAAQVGTLRSPDQTEMDLPDRVLLQRDPTCPADASDPVLHPGTATLWPVSGDITIGSVRNKMDARGNASPALMIAGKLHVFTKAKNVPGMSTSFYTLADFDLPVGSSIAAAPTTGRIQWLFGHQQPSVSWHGVVFNDDTKPGLSVELETDAIKVHVDEPGEEQLDLEVSAASQMFYDPNLLLLYKLFSSIVIFFAVLEWLDGNQKRKDEIKRTPGTFGVTPLLVLGLLLVRAHSAPAQIVRIQNNFKETGQGWKFLDDDHHCKVLTPAHVVQLPEHTDFASELEVTDPESRIKIYGSSPVILSPQNGGLDVAIFSVPALDDPALCKSGGVSADGVQDRILHTNEVSVLSTNSTGMFVTAAGRFNQRSMVSSTAEFRTSVGALATVELTGIDTFHGTWSGSAVVDSTGLYLGMLTKQTPLETGKEGAMVPANLIRNLLNSRPAAKRAGVAGPAGAIPVALITGKPADLTRGPNGLFLKERSGWGLEPVNNRISLLLSLPRPTRIQTIAMHFAGPATLVQGIGIEVNDRPDGDWTSLRYCSLDGRTEGDLRCSVSPVTTRFVRLTLKASGSSAVGLSGLELQ